MKKLIFILMACCLINCYSTPIKPNKDPVLVCKNIFGKNAGKDIIKAFWKKKYSSNIYIVECVWKQGWKISIGIEI